LRSVIIVVAMFVVAVSLAYNFTFTIAAVFIVVAAACLNFSYLHYCARLCRCIFRILTIAAALIVVAALSNFSICITALVCVAALSYLSLLLR